MSTKSEALSTQAAQLPSAERIEVVERILDSMEQPDALLEALWADEVNDRLTAYRRGEIEAVALADAIAKYNQSASYWEHRLG